MKMYLLGHGCSQLIEKGKWIWENQSRCITENTGTGANDTVDYSVECGSALPSAVAVVEFLELGWSVRSLVGDF